MRAVLAAHGPLRQLDTARHELVPRLPEPLDLLGRDEVGDVPAHDLFAGVAEHLPTRAVHVGEAAVQIRNEDAVGRMLDELPHALIGLAHGLLGALAPADVEAHTCESSGLAPGIADEAANSRQPAHGAIAIDHAELALEGIAP